MEKLNLRADMRKLLQAPITESPVKSEILHFPNPAGRRIVGYCDYIPDNQPEKGVVIIAPAYGKSKSSNLTLAYYLVLNGFKVLRYDNTNHVGESEGSILFTTLGQMREDLQAAIYFAEHEFGCPRLTVISSSLGVRVALKEAVDNPRIQLLICLVGVLNLQSTLYNMYREDGVEKALKGIPMGMRDILGFQVDADSFLRDAIQGEFHSIETAMQDAQRLTIPAVFFAAEKDPWVSCKDVRAVVGQIVKGSKELYMLPDTMHELQENPAATDYACRTIVTSVEKFMLGESRPYDTIRVPDPRHILNRTGEEKRRLKSSRGLDPQEERAFWKKYLEKYSYIVNLQDYWNLLHFINQLLGNWKKGERILDAGCGIGTFGTFLLVHYLYRFMQGQPLHSRLPMVRWVGVDFVDEAIKSAMETHEGIQQEFKAKMRLSLDSPDIIDYSYFSIDLNQPLPFRNQSFDKVCCNFVLSYLINPLYTLKGLSRSLKVGGKIVLTSLKPNADLSSIYRDYIKVSRTEREIEQARLVLNNAGMIKHKEAEGYYQFFTQDELQDLLLEVNLTNIRSFRSFGDQANVVVAEKLSP